MSDDIRVWVRVKLLCLPDWLVHDLPESEQAECGALLANHVR
jgi:hypothetical protein